MSFLRVIGQRVALGLVTSWAVLTSVFALFTWTDDWVLDGIEGNLRFAGASEAELELAETQYLAERGLDRPLVEVYVEWLGSMLTLDWGESFVTGDPVAPAVFDAVGRTAAYVVPGILAAILVGLLVGLYAALRPTGRVANTGRGTAYLLFAVPNFWVGGLLLSVVASDAPSPFLLEHALPVALTTTTLIGGYVSYTRAHALEYLSADFVTLVTAKGAGRRRIVAHVLRNAAIPVVSMLFTEALGLLVLAVFVIETLFGIDGFGLLLFDAVNERDLPVLLGATLVVIGVGVVGNVVQDLAYGALDPRVDADGP